MERLWYSCHQTVKRSISAIVCTIKKLQEDIESGDCPDIDKLLYNNILKQAVHCHCLLWWPIGDVVVLTKAKGDLLMCDTTEHWAAEHDGWGHYEAIVYCDEFNVSMHNIWIVVRGSRLFHK